MNSDQREVEAFLTDTDMHPDSINFSAQVDSMLDEMKRGLAGEPSSLAMIPTYVEIDATIPFDQQAVVLDAGGTNLRVALVYFSPDGKSHITDYSKHPMPGTQGRVVSKADFFDTMATLVEPLLKRSSKIGFCFSYPTEIFPDKDGKLIFWTKEVKAPEVVGCRIGSSLKKALSDRGTRLSDVVVLNDTVATTLSGKASKISREWGGYIGFILGTGLNTCYVESNSAIVKLPELNRARSQIINCESGNFRCRHRGRADEMLGELTSDPEGYWLEKMLSGRYFGELARQLILLGADGGLFSSSAVKALRAIGGISTKDADNYLHNPTNSDNPLAAAIKEHGAEDAARLWFLIDSLLERSAKLTAANLASSVLKGRCGNGPLKPVCLSIDGTTFYRYYRYQYRVESWLRPFLSSQDKHYEIVQVADAPLIGAAVAALTN